MIVGTLDVCVLPEQAFQPFQKGIAKATGIPPNHISLWATQTHFAPPLTGLFLNDAETDYLEWIVDTVIDGVIEISHQPKEPLRIGLDLKKVSPFAHTMVIELANGYHGYLPTPEQHRLGGYETWMARSNYLETDTSETITRTLQKMMDRLGYEN